MSSTFIVNYFTGRGHNTKVKVDIWLSVNIIFISRKKDMSRNKTSMFVCTTALYKYMNSLRNDVNDMFDKTHM